MLVAQSDWMLKAGEKNGEEKRGKEEEIKGSMAVVGNDGL